MLVFAPSLARQTGCNSGMLYSPAAGILLTITNQILMKDVNRYKLEADTKSAKPIVNPDYTLTRPKRLNKFEKVNGVKVVKITWQEPEKPQLLRKTAGNLATLKEKKRQQERTNRAGEKS